MDGRTNGRREGRMDGRTNGRAGGRTDGRADGRAGGRADGRAGGRTGGRADGRTDKLKNDHLLDTTKVSMDLVYRYFQNYKLVT